MNLLVNVTTKVIIVKRQAHSGVKSTQKWYSSKSFVTDKKAT